MESVSVLFLFYLQADTVYYIVTQTITISAEPAFVTTMTIPISVYQNTRVT